MTKFSYAQLEGLWEQYGGKASAAPIAAAIAMAESGGDSQATNHNSDGSTDRGLWQINSVHGSQSTYDIAGNVQAAVAISSNGGNWSPWVTYTTGAYRRFLSGNTPPSPVNGTGSSSNASPVDLSSGISDAITNALLAVLKPVFNYVLWGGEALLGLALMIIGGFLLAQQSDTVKSAEDKAATAAAEVAAPEAIPEVEAAKAAKKSASPKSTGATKSTSQSRRPGKASTNTLGEKHGDNDSESSRTRGRSTQGPARGQRRDHPSS